MKLAGLVLMVLTGLVFGDFLDDFESYTPGDDPESSGNWTREETGGYTLVTEQGGDQVIEAFFPDSAYIGYLCTAAGFWDNGSVSMDFNPNGTGSLANVVARLQITTGEAYVGGVIVFLQPFSYAYIGYVSVTGDYELLYSGYGPTVTPDDWVNVRLTLQNVGSDVELTLNIDGEQTAQIVDSQYRLGGGLSGFALFYQEEIPSILADNFQVILAPQTLRAATFGAIKAVFR